MSDHAPGGSERPARPGHRDVHRSPVTRETGAPELTLAVVEYDDRDDRGTVYPGELSGLERMETWLSADLSAFVALDAWR